MAKQVSDLIVERLIEWGVDTIFGFPGDGVDGFFEALRTHQDKLKFIQVRHEEAAAFAAWDMPSTPAGSEYAAPPRGRAEFIFLTVFMTRSVISSPCSPSPATPFTT